MKKNKPSHWNAEFEEFLEADCASVPSTLSDQVLNSVFQKLYPSFWQVLGKLAIVQAAGGALTLLFCPQFGVSLSNNYGLMYYLMQYGENVCMAGCGALFTGVCLLIASLAMKPEEVRVLREHRLLQVGTVAALSLGSLLCLSTDVAERIALIWALGAIVGGLATLELGWSIRRLCYRRRIS